MASPGQHSDEKPWDQRMIHPFSCPPLPDGQINHQFANRHLEGVNSLISAGNNKTVVVFVYFCSVPQLSTPSKLWNVQEWLRWFRRRGSKPCHNENLLAQLISPFSFSVLRPPYLLFSPGRETQWDGLWDLAMGKSVWAGVLFCCFAWEAAHKPLIPPPCVFLLA